MRKALLLFVIITYTSFIAIYAQPVNNNGDHPAIENCIYSQDFEDQLLGAWASYPHWQDLAYDQDFRIGQIIPGDPNTSIIQKVTPYSAVDNYAGAQKLLDMYLVEDAKITFRYFLKTNLAASYFKVRLAAGENGKLDVTLPNPGTNRWVWATVTYDDFIRENPQLAAEKNIRIYALLFLTEIPKADPAMPFYLGLDDISFTGGKPATFQFAEPVVYKLPEFESYIPAKHYYAKDIFHLRGKWQVDAGKVLLEITSYTDTSKYFYRGELVKKEGNWEAKPIVLAYPVGLYTAKLTALNGNKKIGETLFTIHIAPQNKKGIHPRLLFDNSRLKQLSLALKSDRFKQVDFSIDSNALAQRNLVPLSSLIYDLDQFPDENWLPSWDAWGNHIVHTTESLWWNALAFAFHRDKEAGEYAKNVLVILSKWKDWASPWQTKRGRFADHRTGTWSHRLALAYDLVYELMSGEERTIIRGALMKNIIQGVHRTFVFDNNITGNTSNWIAMTVGGSLMNMAAIFDDEPGTEQLEPYFTGAIMKYYSFINKVTGGKDGGWGEGIGYNEYSFSNMSLNIPSLKNVFNIDLSLPLDNSYNEYIWSGILKDRQYFHFGDAYKRLGPMTNWAFLLDAHKNPRLSWLYNFFKEDETLNDILFNTKNIPQDDPFDESPSAVFRKIGTTVFKSGWEKNDFSFSMRTGAFFNHQHLDQGSFMLSDRGVNFIEERHGSTYYDDPLYQSSFIQPVSHSTILINKNAQSQRTGDGYDFAPGLNDNAFIEQYLEGKDAAFSSGNIGRLYKGKIKELKRNVVFIKPRTLLMLDEATPGNVDADISLLYQTSELQNIIARQDRSTITKQGATLHIYHLAPEKIVSEAIETPHYLLTLQKEKPLKREGMLMLTAHTSNAPLIFANLLTSTGEGEIPNVKTTKHDDFVAGEVAGKKFVFSTKPGNRYNVENIATDAMAVVWNTENMLLANARVLKRDDKIIFTSDQPITLEINRENIKYAALKTTKISVSVEKNTSPVIVNGKQIDLSHYDKKAASIIIELPAGNGIIKMSTVNDKK